MNRLMEAVKRSALGKAEQKAGTIEARFLFQDDFPGFSGHFPGYPILPALVQMMAAMSLIEEQMGIPLRLRSVQNAKFLQEIRPGDEIVIQCADRQVEGAIGSRVVIYSGGKTAASFLMTFSG